MEETNVKSIMERLAAPFTKKIGNKVVNDLYWLPKNTTKSPDGLVYFICFPYLKKSQISQRLDEVIGADNWNFKMLQGINGTVIGCLSVFINGKWIDREDVGSESQVEKEKGAATDAFKRCAALLGIGRYLNELPAQRVLSKPKYNDPKKFEPCNQNRKALFGNDLAAYINKYTSAQGYLIQIIKEFPHLWEREEIKNLFNEIG